MECSVLFDYHCSTIQTEEKMDKQTLTERILADDGFGFTVVWSYNETWADVVVYDVVTYDPEDPSKLEYQRKEATSSPDLVDTLEEAAIYLQGFIKWDGCTELSNGDDWYDPPHWCGPFCYKKHISLLEYLYHRAMKLMNQEDEWNKEH